MSTTDIPLPADLVEGTTNTVGKWFKQVGDPVTANEPILEITTDKVSVEVASPGNGVLVEILKQEGEEVSPGELLGRIGPMAEAGPAVAAPAAAPATASRAAVAPANDGAAELAPAVRRLLKEHGIDPTTVVGSGRGGRITIEDAEKAVAAKATGAPATKTEGEPLGGRMVPHTAVRKSMAAHMVASVSKAPHVTSVFEADLSAVVAHREANKAAFEGRGARLTFTAYFVQASVKALQAVPEVNSRWHDHALEIFPDCNIGIGTAVDGGNLIVPVIHRAQALDLFETARQLQVLTEKARTASLAPKDVQGGTFTISNHGVSGSLIAAPIIINQPQSAILGIGKLQRRPVVDATDQLVVRPMIYVTLTIDHRVLDGFLANAFLSRWVEVIEGWQ